MVPESFKKLQIAMPPMLPRLANIPDTAGRFVGVYYECTNPTWDDGRSGGTFNYFCVFSPWVNHFAMAIHLLDADLGSDDTQATHWLVVDREEGKLYLAPAKEAARFVFAQHPPVEPASPEQLQELTELALAMVRNMDEWDLSEYQSHGMFEWLGMGPENQDKLMELTLWLDQQITPELFEAYKEIAFSGCWKAGMHLYQFLDRVKLARQTESAKESN